MMTVELDDVLYGMPQIAQAMKVTTRRACHLKEKHGLPTFKIGRTVCASRKAIVEWLKARAQ